MAYERKNLPELLAPAGGMEQLKAALRFGADAVYGGMKQYGLRAFAGNFDPQGLKEAADYCHARGKKFYVTLNIYPFDEDMEGFKQAGQAAWEAGVDAAIVSDLGAVLLLREQAPQLEIHISTQANTMNSLTARHWHALGAKRVVLSREMSLEQIARMRKAIPDDLELEAFCHGAACMAHSGRCLLSNILTGRGGNQGQCAQPCRWKYHVVEEKRPGEYLPVCEDEHGTYIFSAQDLNLMPLLPQLTEAGIASLKIEGRMKTEYYVATVVNAYRRGLDALAAGTFEQELPGLMQELDKASHRPSNTGFALGAPQPCGNADGFSQSMEYVGRVMAPAQAGEAARLTLKNRFFTGDELELLTPQGPKTFTAPSFILEKTGEAVNTHGVAGDVVLISFPFEVGEGDLLRGPVRNHIKSESKKSSAKCGCP
ncbi:MAG: U32 family peptidase [Clostridia bacterium]|nr:U32 family peptidase [Clostridia bacterium]